jgi:hypothetical protein
MIGTGAGSCKSLSSSGLKVAIAKAGMSRNGCEENSASAEEAEGGDMHTKTQYTDSFPSEQTRRRHFHFAMAKVEMHQYQPKKTLWELLCTARGDSPSKYIGAIILSEMPLQCPLTRAAFALK